MSEAEQSGESVRGQVDAYLDERMSWVADAVELLAGNRELDPLDALPAATVELESARRDGLNPELSAEAEQNLREIAGRFGIGGESDVVGAATHRIAEGGLVWKVEAELENIHKVTGLDTVILAGSPYRTLRDDELEHIKTKYNADLGGETEFDMVRFLMERDNNYIPHDIEGDLGFGYTVDSEHALVEKATGQLVNTGTYFGIPVVLLRVDREVYFDEEDQAERYRHQPDSAALMRFISDVLSACGDDQSAVGLDTSTTYASRAVDTLRAGLRTNRSFDVGMYGRQTLADVQGKPAKEPTEIFQIPSELHTMYEKLVTLKAELDATS